MPRRMPLVIEHEPDALDGALSAAQESFCRAFVNHHNIGLAYRMAYETSHRTSGHVVHLMALELYNDSRVRQRIDELRAQREIEITITRKEIFDDIVDMATADVASIVSVRRVNCRYCGNGSYAWKTPREYADACDKAGALLDCAGGFEFAIYGAPNPDCRECGGIGDETVVIADMATLGPKERKLIKGVKMTATGPEVILHDQSAAKRLTAELTGMLKNDPLHLHLHAQAAPLAPLAPAMTEEEAARLYLEELKG